MVASFPADCATFARQTKYLVARRRSSKEQPIYSNVEILDMGADGKSMARIADKVVFLEGAVPGDMAEIQILKNKKNFYEGKLIAIQKPSAMRTTPFCAHFGTCGGCKWQNLHYEQQLYFKEKQVKDAIERIGKLTAKAFLPILKAEETRFYRNKLEYTFSNARWLEKADMENPPSNMNALGFHVPKRFDKVLDIDFCYLQADPSNAIRLGLKDFALKQQLSFYDIRNNEGLLRNLVIRTANTGQLMVIVQFGMQDEAGIAQVLDYLRLSFPKITSLNYVVNLKLNDTFQDQTVIHASGTPWIEEQMEDLRFRVGPKSFFQTNSKQALELYKIARSFAAIQPDEVVYDLYTGTGTIANFVARQASKVVGIEYVPEAIEDAKVNANINQIGNVSFFAGDMKDVLNANFVATHSRPQVVITDPPRAGMHEAVVQRILEMAPRRIVYVSCNPATQARDMQMLHSQYDLEKIMPVDMFPQTSHVESVALLTNRQVD